jgi:hypothetical protein
MGVASLIEAAIGMEAIETAMEESPEVQIALMRRAEEAKAWWIAYWYSFDHPHSHTHALRSGYLENPGDYAKGIRIKYLREDGHPIARITAHDFKSAWIEYGSKHMPEFGCRAATVAHFAGTGEAIGS